MPIFEGMTVEEAIQSGLTSLNLTKDDVVIEVIDEGKKGFLGIGKKSAQVSIEPSVAEEISEAVAETVAEIEAVETTEPVIVETVKTNSATEPAVKQLEDLEESEAITELALYLTNISKELGAPALVRIAREDNLIIFHLDSQKQGILIGKHGKVLNAIQYLAQVFVHRAAREKLSVVVNVGDYREKRQAILKRLAERTAEKVKRTGQPVFLEPMPAFERKQIHSTLSKDEAIQTHSEGDEPYRYLVVEPAKKRF
ncbi:RNA-binding cell elongation regulator Jag/EloR [Enterococcus canis]|nr:RNA-binding cell elongation regulator Jag/EloR [Enterococcus canis]